MDKKSGLLPTDRKTGIEITGKFEMSAAKNPRFFKSELKYISDKWNPIPCTLSSLFALQLSLASFFFKIDMALRPTG